MSADGAVGWDGERYVSELVFDGIPEGPALGQPVHWAEPDRRDRDDTCVQSEVTSSCAGGGEFVILNVRSQESFRQLLDAAFDVLGVMQPERRLGGDSWEDWRRFDGDLEEVFEGEFSPWVEREKRLVVVRMGAAEETVAPEASPTTLGYCAAGVEADEGAYMSQFRRSCGTHHVGWVRYGSVAVMLVEGGDAVERPFGVQPFSPARLSAQLGLGSGEEPVVKALLLSPPIDAARPLIGEDATPSRLVEAMGEAQAIFESSCRAYVGGELQPGVKPGTVVSWGTRSYGLKTFEACGFSDPSAARRAHGCYASYFEPTQAPTDGVLHETIVDRIDALLELEALEPERVQWGTADEADVDVQREFEALEVRTRSCMTEFELNGDVCDDAIASFEGGGDTSECAAPDGPLAGACAPLSGCSSMELEEEFDALMRRVFVLPEE